MKVLAVCAQCMREHSEAHHTGTGAEPVQLLAAEMDDAGVVVVTCLKGHRAAMLHGNRRHQILFESGCLALLDGYTNEAVSSVTGALERVYEFFIRVACRKLSVDAEVIERSWKRVAAQSERQLGAFLFLYPLIAGDAFEAGDELTSFRNKVIHRGYIARSGEATDYSRAVFDLIKQIMRALREGCPTEMWVEINDATPRRQASVAAGIEHITIHTTEFDLRADLPFEAWLSELRSDRLRLGVVVA